MTRRQNGQSLVPECKGCVEANAEDSKHYCDRSIDPAFQWRDGYCWIRGYHERNAAFPERGLCGGVPNPTWQMGRRVG